MPSMRRPVTLSIAEAVLAGALPEKRNRSERFHQGFVFRISSFRTVGAALQSLGVPVLEPGLSRKDGREAGETKTDWNPNFRPGSL